MTGAYCAVGTCKNSRIKAQRDKLNIKFHHFPKNEEIRKQWIAQCRRANPFSLKIAKLCSIHFKPEDYIRDLKAELMSLPIRKKLKPTAIPTLHLGCVETSAEISAETSAETSVETSAETSLKTSAEPSAETSAKTSANTSVETSAEPSSETSAETNVETSAETSAKTSAGASVETSSIPVTSEDSCTMQDYTLTEYVETILKEYKRKNNPDPEKTLLTKYENIKTQYKELSNHCRQLEIKIETYETDIKILTKKLNVEMKKTAENKEKTALESLLSKNQIDLLLGVKKRAIWSSDDIAMASAIRYFSKKCYIFLRDTLNYPLPGVSSIQRWATKMHIGQGILHDILRFMKIVGDENTSFEKTVVLSYDEIPVSSVYEYEKQNDEVLGPHKHMQVVMARGLFGKWKQVIYVAFDQKMTPDILLKIITELNDISYNVVACVSDCGESNVDLWESLEISTEKTCFPHPVTGKNIYMFADAPDLLKLTRNWLLDTGFVLTDGSIITKAPIVKLLTISQTPTDAGFKLNQSHLTCDREERRDVKLAEQLLSNTTATSLKQHNFGEDAEQTADFIRIVNAWFDLFNSITLHTKDVLKQPYGCNIPSQTRKLDEMYSLVSTMRCPGKRTLQVFQRGILMSITSLKKLFEDVKSTFNVEYILTQRLNQDLLENVLSQLRTSDPPSPLNCISRMRLILQKLNTLEQQETEGFLLSKELKQAEISTANSEDNLENDNFLNIPTDVLSDESEFVEDDLVVWIAKKFENKYPALENYRRPNLVDHCYDQSAFGESQDFAEKIKRMEDCFKDYNKETFGHKDNVVKKLYALVMKKHIGLPKEVVETYIKQRLFIRITFLNAKLEENKSRVECKRKLPSVSKDNGAKKKK